MKNLKEILTEKLHLDKNINNVNDELFNEVYNIIIEYIRRHLRINISDCKIEKINNKKFTWTLPSSQNDLKGISLSLSNEINKQLNLSNINFKCDIDYDKYQIIVIANEIH